MSNHTVYYTIEIQGERTVEADTRAEAREDVHSDLDMELVDIQADSLLIKTYAATGFTQAGALGLSPLI